MGVYGRHAVVPQCQPVKADFEVVPTRCYWQGPMAFNGEAYTARDGVWVEEEPPRQAKHNVLLTKFKQTVDLLGFLLTAGLGKGHSL